MILICHPRLFSFLLIIDLVFLDVFVRGLLIVWFVLIAVCLGIIETFVQVSLFFVAHARYRIRVCREGLLGGLEISE
jgi:hypothetical protein